MFASGDPRRVSGTVDGSATTSPSLRQPPQQESSVKASVSSKRRHATMTDSSSSSSANSSTSSSSEEEEEGPVKAVARKPAKPNGKRRLTLEDDEEDSLVDTDDDDDDDDEPRRVKDSTAEDDFLVDTDDDDDDDDENDEEDTEPSDDNNMKHIHDLPKLTRKPKPSPTTNSLQNVHHHADDDMQDVQDKKEGDPVAVHDDVEFIDEVEWASPDDDNYNNNSNKKNAELAMKPKLESGDPCGCTVSSFDEDEFCRAATYNANDTETNTKPKYRYCIDPSCILFACQEECRSNCEAGQYCGNKRIQRKEWKQIEVFHAGPKGRGLRTLEHIQKGEFILEYIGRAVRASFLSKLFHRYKQERRLYIMALDTNVYLDARKKGSVARYINHSCEPNCVVERWKVRGIIRAGIFATRDIPKGQELSFDYQWERKKGRAPTKCYCGANTCRGTLEVPKSLEEVEFEKISEGHWKTGSRTAGREIINRSIRILSKEHEQYFYADVCKYDEQSKKHLVIYRPDWEEVWEELAKEDWQVLLDESDVGDDGSASAGVGFGSMFAGARDFVIAKKVLHNRTAASPSSSWQRSFLQTLVASPNAKNRPGGASLLDKVGAGDRDAIEELKAIKPYLYVQTPIKEAFWAKHLIQRCERNCRVSIVPKQFARPPLGPDANDPDDVEKHKALDESLDGTVWKLSISGYNVAKACTILEKNVIYLTKQQQQQQQAASLGDPKLLPGSASKPAGKLNVVMAANRGGTGLGIAGLTGLATGASTKSNDNLQEVVIPRCAVDNFKRRLPFVREKCRSVNISFAHSESKSKQFAKLVMEATLQSDMHAARENVWLHLNDACAEVKAPKTPNEIFYRDLGFLGGELTREQFQLLRQDEPDRMSQDCREDLRKSPFFVSFESTQRCTVWVQSEEDKGRIDGSNNIVGEATPYAPRKIFFGCDPKDVTKLWALMQTRASEVARGVKYLYLGADRVYLPFMIQNGAKFFDYVKRVTGAAVMVDHMTGDHLRIDGRSYLAIHTADVIDVDKSSADTENERVRRAEEMIRLQIEIYRDHCIRRQNWIFGRDWTLSKIVTAEYVASDSSGGTSSTPVKSAAVPSRQQFDEKTVCNSCQEIADITMALGTTAGCGVSAALIFYRFVTIVCQQDDFDTQLKVREIVLACIFLANKAQKVSKWKRLEEVLKAAYQVFYPGASFDGSKEEVLILADKVQTAESEILTLLDYDVFNRGTDWIVAAAVEAAGFKGEVAQDALNVACCGPVLAAGSSLWLKYGVEYVFAAAAGFLHCDIDKLFPALALIPLKVSQAAEIIVESIKVIPTSKRSSSHPLFEEGKENLKMHLPRIKEICVKCMASSFGQQTTPTTSEAGQRFRLIGSRDCRRHAIQGVPRLLVKDVILPVVDGASAESKCNIYIGDSAVQDADDIVLEGSWRAVAIAEHLLRASVANVQGNPLPPSVDISVEIDVLNKNKLQAKVKPGLLSMSSILSGDGWSGTIQSEVSGGSSWGRKTGGKICVPGKLAASSLREVGLRWWVPPQHGPSPTGSICDMFLIRSDPHDLHGGLQRLTQSFSGESGSFPLLCGSKDGKNAMNERYVAVSLQRWPSEKVETRELEKTKKSKKSKRSSGLGMGFSAAALQEMQLLNELHSVIPSPQGHPNFILPVAVALPPDEEEEEEEQPEKDSSDPAAASSLADDIFSLFRTSEENEKVARREKKRKEHLTGPHLVFQPSPFVLQRFMSRKKRKGTNDDNDSSSPGIGPAIFSSWFHDLLSALVHCHTNHVVVRSFQADQIVIDHSGVAKLGGLYRATVISPEDRNVTFDPLKFARANKKDKKDRKSRGDDDDDVSDPYIAPENLFGCSKRTKETDVWSLGCLLAHVLLNKALFSGRDRQALLNSMYKVVGTPARDNYEICVKYPHYSRPPKKYKRGVEKAIQHVLKEDSEKHAGAVDLLAKMLHLDPSRRITAVEALRHYYMLDYIENSNSGSFRRRFVEDWMSLKGKLMKSSQSQEDKALERERNLKRKAEFSALGKAAGAEQDDDLYNLDELFRSAEASKKQKT
ncbi:36 and H4 lysine-20 specific [Seminavis robusta]|uniref:36 and H4 lysine-20 specific n=1 Tax=Seminavis robusta TaxID=568900 RepID=A0A9N8DFJ6_9STRA|nr:36 and H4 lysine-20 specific [Seminavis robusta]|eukprot:Sro117_g057370.1 36 and H4 lysine-20 specific (2048) ;mRNA; f:42586-48729